MRYKWNMSLPMSALERLRTEGGLYEATEDLGGLAEPLELEPGQELPSAVLAALRADER